MEKRLMVLDIQRFADGESEPVQEPVQEPTKLSFTELLKDPEYQSEFDKLNAKSLETAKAKWQTEYEQKLQAEKSEAEKLAKMDAEQKAKYELKKVQDELADTKGKLNSIELYKTASDVAVSKGLPIEYLSLIDFTKQTADTINTAIDKLVEIRNKDMKEYLQKNLREQPPVNKKEEPGEKIDPYIAGFNSIFE